MPSFVDIYIEDMLDLFFTNLSKDQLFDAKEAAEGQYNEEAREQWLKRHTVQKED